MCRRTSEALLNRNGMRNTAFGVGGLGLLLCGAAGLQNPQAVLPSYLAAYLFFLGLSVGSLGFLLLHELVGGLWGQTGRREFESAAGNLWLLALLFVPLGIGLPYLYEWADPHHAADDVLLQHKKPYLNVPFFLARAAGYFAVWMTLARQVRKRRLSQGLGGPGLVLWVLTVSFAAMDWAMSLEPHWYSSAYGAIILISQALSALAFVVVLGGLAGGAGTSALGRHDLGNLLLAFVMLWAYLSFSQYLLIWYGHLPEETSYYLRRTQGFWEAVAIFLALFHFSAPFVVLLFRSSKRNIRVLTGVAAVILISGFVHALWLIKPAFPAIPAVAWTDVAAGIGIGGFWFGAFLARYQRTPAWPDNRAPASWPREAPAHGS
jgi:hypothetical protein